MNSNWLVDWPVTVIMSKRLSAALWTARSAVNAWFGVQLYQSYPHGTFPRLKFKGGLSAQPPHACGIDQFAVASSMHLMTEMTNLCYRHAVNHTSVTVFRRNNIAPNIFLVGLSMDLKMR